MDIYPIQYKHCNKCNTTKSIDQFSKSNTRADKLAHKCKECDKAYRQLNYETIRQKDREYKELNKVKLAEYMKQYRQLPHAQLRKRELDNTYSNARKQIDPLYKLTGNLRTLIGKTLRVNGFKKNSKTEHILGCTFDEFKHHIESQFVEGMNWDNRHLWHLDHIVPVSIGLSEMEILQLNHYTNFRPLWARDNLLKGDLITIEVMNHPLYQRIISERK